jgi:hypothetical protein
VIDHYLRDVYGLYVVEFPDRVKIGMSQGLRGRCQAHIKDGALQIAAFPVWTPMQDWSENHIYGRALDQIEAYALSLAAQHGERVGHVRCESFRGLTFEQATDCVSTALTARRGGPVHRIAVSFDVMTTPLLHVSEVMRRRYAARRAELAAS